MFNRFLLRKLATFTINVALGSMMFEGIYTRFTVLQFLGYSEPLVLPKKNHQNFQFSIQLIIVRIIEHRDLEGFNGLTGSCDHGFTRKSCSFLLFCRIGRFMYILLIFYKKSHLIQNIKKTEKIVIL